MNRAVKLGKWALGFTAQTGILLCAMLYFGQDKMLLHPTRPGQFPPESIGAPGWATPWEQNGAYAGMVYAPLTAPKGTFVVYHGNAGTARDRENIARVLTDRGFRAVLVEYPEFDGRPGDATLRNALQTSLADFKQVQKTWPGPYYLLGESMGAGMVAQVAAQNLNTVAGVALFTPWDSLYNATNGKFFGLPVGLMLKEKFDSVAALSAYKGPVVVVAAEKDSLIPVRHAKALAAGHPGAKYLELAGSSHTSWPVYMKRPDWDAVLGHMTSAPGEIEPARQEPGS